MPKLTDMEFFGHFSNQTSLIAAVSSTHPHELSRIHSVIDAKAAEFKQAGKQFATPQEKFSALFSAVSSDAECEKAISKMTLKGQFGMAEPQWADIRVIVGIAIIAGAVIACMKWC